MFELLCIEYSREHSTVWTTVHDSYESALAEYRQNVEVTDRFNTLYGECASVITMLIITGEDSVSAFGPEEF